MRRIMFENVEPLSFEKHQDIRYNQINSYDFAKKILTAPLGISEVSRASKFYPIVFSKDKATPVALFALNQEVNQYITEEGQWKVPYIPAHIRRYPFVFGRGSQETEEKKYTLCIDSQAPHFSSDQGEPLFTANGEPADVTQNAISFLEQFQAQIDITQTFCNELKEAEILDDKSIILEKDGQQSALSGVLGVNLERMKELEDTVLAKWVRNEIIGLIFFHHQSIQNFNPLN